MTEPITTDNPFTAAELQVLKTLASLIIPPSEEYQLPGANDDTIFADITWSARNNEAEIRAGIQFAQALLPAADKPLEAVIEHLEGQADMAAIVATVVQCYYRDDRVMESLGMEARAPFPKGFEVEQGDWSMLEAVQRRGKIWRDAP